MPNKFLRDDANRNPACTQASAPEYLVADPVLAIQGPQGERTPENYPPGIKHAGFTEKFGMVGQPTEAPKWGPACGTVLPETRAPGTQDEHSGWGRMAGSCNG